MKTLILGNSGSGKTTLARTLAAQHGALYLALDCVAFAEGAARKPLMETVSEIQAVFKQHPNCVVEGCYADIARAILADIDRLIFLNPGTETCIQQCRLRPWEPDKYETPEEQSAMLETLINWVSTYDSRTDEYGLFEHQAVFRSFTGDKVKLTDPATYSNITRWHGIDSQAVSRSDSVQ